MTTEIFNALDLRSTELADDQVSHPDERPCPPWCWVAHHNPNGYAHETDPDHLLTKVHTLDWIPEIRASLYAGEKNLLRTRSCYEIHTATIEPRLVQHNQALPEVNIGLRTYERVRDADGKWRTQMKYEDERLRLTIADACELVTVLEYLIDVAKGVREPIVEHDDDCLRVCASGDENSEDSTAS